MDSKEKKRLYQKQYYKDNIEKMRKKSKLYNANLSEEQREKVRQRTAKHRKVYKALVFNHYGNNKPKCVCCGESMIEFLTLDHIRGGGMQHRKRLHNGNASSSDIYRDIVKNNYPKGFQILCYNCNCAKGSNGKCPHNK